MRRVAVLVAALTAAVAFIAIHLMSAASSVARDARDTKSQATATTNHVRIGIISYNLPLFVRRTKIHPALTATYVNWGVPFPAARVRANHALGATTLIVLEPRGIGPRRVIAGKGDGYLKRFAEAERRLGLPIILSFAPEANGIWYSWGKGHIRAALYTKMYRYVRYILLRDGLRHTTWLWQVDRTSRATEPLKLLWPGRSYVNEIGLDGQLAGARSSFYSVFGSTLAQVRGFTNVPVMLSEVGVQRGRSRAAKVTGLISAARRVHVTALNFFDVGAWNFDADPSTLAVIRKAAA